VPLECPLAPCVPHPHPLGTALSPPRLSSQEPQAPDGLTHGAWPEKRQDLSERTVGALCTLVRPEVPLETLRKIKAWDRYGGRRI
jgi:hypothetical protein